MDYILKNSDLTLTLSDIGAEPKSLILKDKTEVLYQCDNSAYNQCSPILFPLIGFGDYDFNGKKYDVGFHGFASKTRFDVNQISDERIEFTTSSTPKTMEFYPFEFTLKITYSLEKSTISITYEIENNGSQEMYFSIGSHTGYRLDKPLEEYTLCFNREEDNYINKGYDPEICNSKIIKDKTLQLGSYLFEKGAQTFINLNSDEVYLKENNAKSIVTVNMGDFKYLTLWSVPNGNYICIEPWSCESAHYKTTNALEQQNGIYVLQSGENSYFKHSLKF